MTQFLSLPLLIDFLHHIFVFLKGNYMSWFGLKYLSSNFPLVELIAGIIVFYMQNKLIARTKLFLQMRIGANF
jgi:hypothetical protein